MYKYCTTVHTVLSVLRTVQMREKLELAFIFFAARRNAFQWFKLEECYCSGRPLSAVSFRGAVLMHNTRECRSEGLHVH